MTKILNKIYLLGDRILSRHWNTGYKAIKLIEPISTVRISELASAYRPLITEFPDFKEHVLSIINDTAGESPGLTELSRVILQIDSVDLALTVFGAFRHWGHPFIAYLEGLKKVEQQVNMDKNIDEGYANVLASDLAFIVLESNSEKQSNGT
ncbi:unnamed protein product [Pieris brassicae]|uniref:RdRp catalytic domain-containing protein n=1 Tax=Pieris brassicae TaxID=7116 RepID=A0A9P0TQD3_PIEBR|nr:unnamed protein product [Pieris brassicae]